MRFERGRGAYCINTLYIFRVEFLAGDEIIRAYEVKAVDAREALVMARIDLPRMKKRHRATNYRVFDPISLRYLNR